MLRQKLLKWGGGKKLLSPGITQLTLCSSWQVQWWSEFSGVGRRNSDEGLKMLCCQPGLPAGFADGIIAPEGAVGEVQSRTGTTCCPFCQWSKPLTHRLPCSLLLTSAVVITVHLQQREGEGKPRAAHGSVQQRLLAGVRFWTRELDVSMCHQQSWSDWCCIIYMAVEGDAVDILEMIPAALLRAALESLRLPGLFITLLSLSCLQVISGGATHLDGCHQETQGEFGWRGAQLRGISVSLYGMLSARLLLLSLERREKVLRFF